MHVHVYMSVSVYVSVTAVAEEARRGLRSHGAGVYKATQVLGTKPRSSAKATSAPAAEPPL